MSDGFIIISVLVLAVVCAIAEGVSARKASTRWINRPKGYFLPDDDQRW